VTFEHPINIHTPEKLLNQIRGQSVFKQEILQQLNSQVYLMLKKKNVLQSISDLTFLDEIHHAQKDLIRRAAFISPKLVFVSEKIKSLCHLKYEHSDGRIDPCGGIKKNYLACSPYSPNESEIKKQLDSSDLICFLQADNLTDMKQQKYLHEILFEVENYLRRMGILVVMSFGAGPCRMCEQCAGELHEECYAPVKRRFSLESCGIDVGWAMEAVALITGNEVWKLIWLKDFGLKSEDKESFKSVMGIMLRV
jgi:predicted metal-binding protein